METIRWLAICPGGEALHLAWVNGVENPRGRLHRHDFYECFLVESGSGVHWLAEGREVLEPGDFFMVRPEHVHGLHSRGPEPLTFINVAASASVVELLADGFGSIRQAWGQNAGMARQVFTRHQVAAFRELVGRLATGARGAEDAAFFVFGLLRILHSAEGEDAALNLPPWLADALPLAAEADNLQGGTARLIELCARSPEHVARSFQKHLGRSPSQWMAQQRIAQARRLLETGNLPIVEIALECGIQSLGYFHRLFKAQTGSTPLAYRRQHARVQSAGR